MTDAVKHTPGPWSFDGDNAVMADVGAHICTVSMADDFPCVDDYEGAERANVDIECKANARLIAAAPELLEASKKVLVAWRHLVEGLAQDDRIEEVEFNEFMEMRAVVAKAVGIAPWEVSKFLASEVEGS